MPEEEKETGKITEVVKAVTGLVDKVPVYQDAVQPAAKEVGKGLKVVAKAVNAALIPVEGLIWGVEQIRDFVRERVEKKLENVPPEEIQQPKAHIAVPAIEALRYTGAEETLSELYANLLATSMDQDTAYRAHPGFVDMIKNMCPDEARIMKQLAVEGVYPIVNIKVISNKDRSYIIAHRYVSLLGVDSKCEHVRLTPNYIDNLERLGLIQVDTMSKIHNEEAYKPIEEHEEIASIVEDLNKNDGKKADIQRMRLLVTDLGKQFIRSCVIDKNLQTRS